MCRACGACQRMDCMRDTAAAARRRKNPATAQWYPDAVARSAGSWPLQSCLGMGSQYIDPRRERMDQPPSIRIVIADDHQILRAGLKSLLRAEPGFVF